MLCVVYCAPKFSLLCPNYAPLCPIMLHCAQLCSIMLTDSLSESEDTISLTASIFSTELHSSRNTIIALELAPRLISDNYF